MNDFAKRLLAWREKFGRKGLPWQGQKDPYRVWLSEIMLQQTQVATVIERYEVFLKRFPTIDSLAKASQEDVLAMWSGMGYYTRARNLWACAKQVSDKYGGDFPRSAEELVRLPGIGPSTAAAIAAFCFNEQRSILDGNVKRVLARVFGIEKPINQSSTEKELWTLANRLVPKNPDLMPFYTQALMDFGATACTPKKVLCQNKAHENQRTCVFQNQCKAYSMGKVDLIPFKTPKKISPHMTCDILVVFSNNRVLLEQRALNGIWGGLWSLPETPWVDLPEDRLSATNKNTHPFLMPGAFLEMIVDPHSRAKGKAILKAYQEAKVLAPIKHVFSHRVLFFKPRVMRLGFENLELDSLPQMAWFKKTELDSLGLPTPIRNLLNSFESFS